MTGTFMGGAAAPVEIKIFGQELAELRRYADDVVARIKDVPGIRDVTHSLAQAKPEYHIKIDRDRAARFGLTVNQVESAVQMATLGQIATRYREAGRGDRHPGPVQGPVPGHHRGRGHDPHPGPHGDDRRPEPGRRRRDRARGRSRSPARTRPAASRSRPTSPSRDLGSVVRDVKARIAPVEKGLPAGYFLEIGGSYEQMSEAFVTLAGVFALAVLLVYMVMASQFESLKHPFIILFTIPMCLIGIVIGLAHRRPSGEPAGPDRADHPGGCRRQQRHRPDRLHQQALAGRDGQAESHPGRRRNPAAARSSDGPDDHPGDVPHGHHAGPRARGCSIRWASPCSAA